MTRPFATWTRHEEFGVPVPGTSNSANPQNRPKLDDAGVREGWIIPETATLRPLVWRGKQFPPGPIVPPNKTQLNPGKTVVFFDFWL